MARSWTQTGQRLSSRLIMCPVLSLFPITPRPGWRVAEGVMHHATCRLSARCFRAILRPYDQLMSLVHVRFLEITGRWDCRPAACLAFVSQTDSPIMSFTAFRTCVQRRTEHVHSILHDRFGLLSYVYAVSVANAEHYPHSSNPDSRRSSADRNRLSPQVHCGAVPFRR